MNGENVTQSQAPMQQAGTPTQAAPATNPMPAQTSPMPSSAGDEFADLRRLSAAGAERMARSGVSESSQGNADSGSPDGSGNDISLPIGLVDNTAANASQPLAPTTQPVQQNQATQQNQPNQQQQQQQQQNAQPNQPQADQAEQQARDLSKVVLRNAQGQEMSFDNDQLLGMLQGYQHYNSQIQNIQQDFNQKYQGLESRRQEVEARAAQIDALMNSEKGFLLEALETNPQFAEKVAALLNDQPDLLTTYQNRKIENGQAQNQDRVAQLEQQLSNFIQQQQQQAVQAEQARAQAQQKVFYDQTVQSVQSNVAELNKQFNLPARTLDALTAQAVLEVQAGKLPFDSRALSGWFGQQMQAIAQDFGAIKQQVTTQYLNQKQQAAPPPPTGGGTPAITNNTPTTPGDRVRMVTQLLQRSTNGIR
jgi:hypothetical protein